MSAPGRRASATPSEPVGGGPSLAGSRLRSMRSGPLLPLLPLLAVRAGDADILRRAKAFGSMPMYEALALHALTDYPISIVA